MKSAFINAKIACVIVTYNNPSMLADILQDLFRQSLQPIAIIVFDNSNVSETECMIRQKYEEVIYLKMDSNVGTAGGFHEGIKRAIVDCDFVLTLDDDVRMGQDAVEELYTGFIELQKKNDRVGAVRAVGHHKNHRTSSKLDDFAWRGTLIKTEAIKQTGLPFKEYFMYADDVEYSMRLSGNGYQFFDIPGSIIREKRDWDKRKYKLLGRKIVFYDEDFRFYYAVRNAIHAYRKHKRYKELLKVFTYGVKISIFLILFQRSKELGKLKAIWDGFVDGISADLGKKMRYLPNRVN